MAEKHAVIARHEQTIRRERDVASRTLLSSAVLIAAIIAVVLSAFAATGELVPGEVTLAEWWQDTPGGRYLEPIADAVALPYVQYSVFGAAVLYAFWRRNYPLALAGLLAVLALGTNPVLKELFGRDRPLAGELILREDADNFGFPSGHATTSVLLYGYVIVVAAQHLRTRIAAAVISAFALVIPLIWWDRVWDGSHWPSDVAGGATIAFLLLVLAIYAARPIYEWALDRVRRWIPP